MSNKQLTQSQRYHLYEMIQMRMLQKDMAKILGVLPSTISREIHTNKGKRGTYIKGAHQLTLARRKNQSKRRISEKMRALVEKYQRFDINPEQVALRLKY